MLTALIMAGGSGTRFWPLSRKDKPKQFLKLNNSKKSMLEETAARINKLVPAEQIFVATNKLYKSEINKQLADIPEENIIVEPQKRNTAAAVGLSSVIIENRFPNSTMIVLPADHLIKEEERFIKLLKKAVMAASIGENLLTVGIKATRPETGYGYINCGKKLFDIDGEQIFKVDNFAEKPDLDTAKKFLKSGNYLWNSGIFIWKVNNILANFEKHLPDLYLSLEKIRNFLGKDSEKEMIEKEFKKMKKISIDYGIMEKTEDIAVIPAAIAWDDIGSWPALSRIKETDALNNIKEAEHYGIDTKNSIIYSDSDKIIATIGIDNLIIVNTDDAILICDKKRAQDVKKIRNILAEENLDKYL